MSHSRVHQVDDETKCRARATTSTGAHLEVRHDYMLQTIAKVSQRERFHSRERLLHAAIAKFGLAPQET